MREQTQNVLWEEGIRRPRGEALKGDVETDVVVIGAGITGLTTALLLASEQRRVIVLEAHQIGSGTSGRTSAHVSVVPDMGYDSLVRRLGTDGGRTYVQRLQGALEYMDDLVAAEQIECGWTRLPAYWFSEDAAGAVRLAAEAAAAERLGQECRLVPQSPLPWTQTAALALPRQAVFHPLRYLLHLAELARRRGAILFERTPMMSWEDSPEGVLVQTSRGVVRARELVLATHTPVGFNLLQTLLTPIESYLLTVALPEGLAPALYWDTSDPYYYIRPYGDDGRPLVLVGGCDHKTGQEDEPQARYTKLAEYVRDRLPRATVTGWWSAQLFEPADGLPYIGRSPLAHHVSVATGFAGVGLVQGTMAAMELTAMLRGEGTDDAPWSTTRLSLSAAPTVVSETVNVARQWIGDRLSATDGHDVADVQIGAGAILRLEGHRRAVYRGNDGRLHILSPVCPHLGCLVRWNVTANTWDCPCHGSRFAPTGEVLEGPALSGLTRMPSSDASPYAGAPSGTPRAESIRVDADKG